MVLFKCSVCGYLAESGEAPEKCPRCGAPREKFQVLGEEDASKISRSRLSNNLHGELLLQSEKLLDIANKGIEDNLDPTCLTIFTYCKEQALILRQLAKAEIGGHVSKGKWG